MQARQAYLGTTSQGAPGLQRRPAQPRFTGETHGPCFFDIIPDELLSQILEYLPPSYRRWPFVKNPPWSSIPLTCSRWHRVYEPVLYQILDVRFEPAQSVHLNKIADRLRERPSICQHVKTLNASLCRWPGESPGMKEPGDLTCRLMVDIIQRCKAIQYLTLEQTPLSPKLRPILYAIANLPHLTSLFIWNFTSSPAVQILLKLFDLPTFKEFNIQNCSFGENDDLAQPLGRIYHPSARELKEVFSDHYGRGATTHLYLSTPDASMSVIKALLRWPARLTRLTLNRSLYSACQAGYPLSAMQDLLEVHGETLQHIELCIIPGDQCGSPQLAHFPVLKTLHLNKYNLLFDSPQQAYQKLTAPNLRKLIIDFDGENEHEDGPTTIGPPEVLWLQAYANHMNPQRLYELFVEFYPNVSPLDLNEEEFPKEMVWPWVYLDQAVDILAKKGVKMTYCPPSVSRQEWDERPLTRPV